MKYCGGHMEIRIVWIVVESVGLGARMASFLI
jgi:hypothetical protein